MVMRRYSMLSSLFPSILHYRRQLQSVTSQESQITKQIAAPSSTESGGEMDSQTTIKDFSTSQADI